MVVRSLQPRHLPKVRRMWRYSELEPDTDAVLTDSQAAGLAVGVFLTQSSGIQPLHSTSAAASLDEPVAWTLVNTYGAQSFGYTEAPFRRHGLQRQAFIELCRRTVRRDIPVFGYTTDTNVSARRTMLQAGYIAEHVTQWMYFESAER